MAKTFHSGSIKRSVIVKASKDTVWRSIRDITGLPKWAIGVKSCRYRTKAKRGVGAVRDIVFFDGSRVEEHVVAWNRCNSFSYVAVSGLPLRVYVATISLERVNVRSTRIVWQSYLSSKKMTGAEFTAFLTGMKAFYHNSLKNLKMQIEK